MKKCYIIVFKLSSPLLNRQKVIDSVKSAQVWAKLNENVYVISTVLTAEQIRDALLGVLYEGDKIYVGLLKNQAAWYGLDKDVSEWLQSNQK